jgi:hypothetical protein
MALNLFVLRLAAVERHERRKQMEVTLNAAAGLSPRSG